MSCFLTMFRSRSIKSLVRHHTYHLIKYRPPSFVVLANNITSSLSKRKQSSVEENRLQQQQDLEKVGLEIKAIEHCLKDGTSAPSADIVASVRIHEGTERGILSSLLVKLQEEKNILLQRQANMEGNDKRWFSSTLLDLHAYAT